MPVPGHSLKLTLDREVQEAAVFGLRKVMEAIEKEFPTKAATAVAIDVRTGGVLALASEPSFDPNIFTKETIPPDIWASISDPTWQPQLNRAIRGVYPPGSTFKMVTATADWRQEPLDPRTLFWTGAYTGASNRKNAGKPAVTAWST